MLFRETVCYANHTEHMRSKTQFVMLKQAVLYTRSRYYYTVALEGLKPVYLGSKFAAFRIRSSFVCTPVLAKVRLLGGNAGYLNDRRDLDFNVLIIIVLPRKSRSLPQLFTSCILCYKLLKYSPRSRHLHSAHTTVTTFTQRTHHCHDTAFICTQF
jgi:hypothetical protein